VESSKTDVVTNMALAKPMDPVDPGKYYRVSIQMGSGRSWRNLSGRRREARVDPATGKTLFHHNPVVHKNYGPLTGDEVNGLIGEHVEWLTAYNQRDSNSWQGHLDQQLLVLGVTQTTDMPAKQKKALTGSVDVIGLLEGLVARFMSQKTPTAKA
jgi:hypothetical protein